MAESSFVSYFVQADMAGGPIPPPCNRLTWDDYYGTGEVPQDLLLLPDKTLFAGDDVQIDRLSRICLDPPMKNLLKAPLHGMLVLAENERMIISLLTIAYARYKLIQVWPADDDPKDRKGLVLRCISDFLLKDEHDPRAVRAKLDRVEDMPTTIDKILKQLEPLPGHYVSFTGLEVFDYLTWFVYSIRHARDTKTGPSFWSSTRCVEKPDQVMRNAVFVMVAKELFCGGTPFELRSSFFETGIEFKFSTRKVVDVPVVWPASDTTPETRLEHHNYFARKFTRLDFDEGMQQDIVNHINKHNTRENLPSIASSGYHRGPTTRLPSTTNHAVSPESVPRPREYLFSGPFAKSSRSTSYGFPSHEQPISTSEELPSDSDRLWFQRQVTGVEDLINQNAIEQEDGLNDHVTLHVVPSVEQLTHPTKRQFGSEDLEQPAGKRRGLGLGPNGNRLAATCQSAQQESQQEQSPLPNNIHYENTVIGGDNVKISAEEAALEAEKNLLAERSIQLDQRLTEIRNLKLEQQRQERKMRKARRIEMHDQFEKMTEEYSQVMDNHKNIVQETEEMREEYRKMRGLFGLMKSPV